MANDFFNHLVVKGMGMKGLSGGRVNACEYGTAFDSPAYQGLGTMIKICLRLPSMSDMLKSFSLNFTCKSPGEA